jgi:hypothetical protein
MLGPMGMKTVLVLLIAVSATACEKKACTLVGCNDQASIAIRRGDDGALPLVVEVDIDGRKVTCTPQQTESTCGSDVRIAPSGRLEEVVTVTGTPSRVNVVLSSGAQRSFDLSYSASRPNGPGCDPICRQASASWDLPPPIDGGASDGSVADGPTDGARSDATVDAPADASLPGDALPDGSSSDARFRCGTSTCSAGEVCVTKQIAGGACFPVGDAGCPAGYSPAFPCCVADPVYQCTTRPAACGAGLTCACAGPSLCGSGFLCSTLDSEQIRCTLLAP